MKKRYPWIAWGAVDGNGISTDGDGQIAAYRVTDDRTVVNGGPNPGFGKSVIIAHNAQRNARENTGDNQNVRYGYIQVPSGYEVADVASALLLQDQGQFDGPDPIYDQTLNAWWLKPYTTVIFKEREEQ